MHAEIAFNTEKYNETIAKSIVKKWTIFAKFHHDDFQQNSWLFAQYTHIVSLLFFFFLFQLNKPIQEYLFHVLNLFRRIFF